MFLTDRREFVLASGSLALTVALGGCEKLKKQIANRPVRKDIASLATNDPILQAYRDAIAQMQAMPSGDPRNWIKQAQIHLNHCPHGNWFFLPWHRGYLMAIDDIIRKLTGMNDFSMPYWNWSCQRSLPASFWQAGSVLNYSPRGATSSSQANASIVGPNNIATILGQADFQLFGSGAATALRGGGGFQGELEAQPHNYIHGFVGGTMGTYTSPRDPIFWLHHCNIDRLWYDWNSAGNANTNDPVYTNMHLTMFVDGNGQPLDYQVGALVLAPLLTYRYATPNGCIPNIRRLDDAVLKKLLQNGRVTEFRPIGEFAPVATNFPLSTGRTKSSEISLPARAVGAALANVQKTRLVLRLDDVKTSTTGDYFVRVFVDLPDGAPATPESDSYAGAFAFFVDPEHNHGPANVVVDLSDAIERLNAKQTLRTDGQGRLSLILVPGSERTASALAAAPPKIVIGRITPQLIARDDAQRAGDVSR